LRIFPVIDIKDGIVVRGVAGRRDSYRGVQSCLVRGHNISDVAEALRDHFELNRLYLADLDAILHGRPHLNTYAELVRRGFDLTVDAGLREPADAERLRDVGVGSVVAGLETIPGPKFLNALCAAVGADATVFSLDLKQGRPLFATDAAVRWEQQTGITPNPGDSTNTPSPTAAIHVIAAQAHAAGVRRMIVLDLAGVGTSNGVPTLTFCGKLLERFPDVEVTTGGGVRDAADLRRLRDAGVHGALIASALHTGAITPHDLRALHQP